MITKRIGELRAYHKTLTVKKVDYWKDTPLTYKLYNVLPT